MDENNTEITTAEAFQIEYERVMRMINHDIKEAKRRVRDLKANKEATEKAWKYAMEAINK